MMRMHKYGIAVSVLAALLVSTSVRAAVLLNPVSATASSEFPTRVATNTINASDVSLTTYPTAFASAATVLATGSPVPVAWPVQYYNNQAQEGEWMTWTGSTNAWIQFDLGGKQRVVGAHVWNYFEAGGYTRYIDTMAIAVAPDNGGIPGTWTTLGATPSLTVPSEGYTGDELNFTTLFGGAAENVRFVKFTILTAPDGLYAGLNEVRFEVIPEPATFALLALGGLFLFRLRHGFGRQGRRVKQ